jgi:hypothetical protein
MIGNAELAESVKKEFRKLGVYDVIPPGNPAPVKGRSKDGWCRCEGERAPSALSNYKTYTSGRMEVPQGLRRPLDQFESIKVRFLKPIEEPYEIELKLSAGE